MAAETVHACPEDGSAVTSCCGRTPFELPALSRMTTDTAQVTCGRAGPTRLTAEQIHDAGYTMAAVGSVAYSEARLGFGRVLTSALEHGLTVADLAEATGRTESLVRELVEEASR